VDKNKEIFVFPRVSIDVAFWVQLLQQKQRSRHTHWYRHFLFELLKQYVCIEWVKRTFDQEREFVQVNSLFFDWFRSRKGGLSMEQLGWLLSILGNCTGRISKEQHTKYINEITKIFNNSIHETAETANFVTGEIQDFNVLF